MRKMNYLFVYFSGWGNDNLYFTEFNKILVKTFFKEGINIESFYFDSCYFKESSNLEDQKINLLRKIKESNFEKIIGIGHSIGFIKLLKLNKDIKFNFLFSFAGFLKFVNSKKDSIALDLTIKAFDIDPQKVIFNLSKKELNVFNKEILMVDLEMLKYLDFRNELMTNEYKDLKLFHIYGKRDLILGDVKSINETLEYKIFIEEVLDTSTHNLPYYKMQECLEFVVKNVK